MKTTVIMQARMGSTRLSGKVMKQLFGKTVLEHDIERIRQCVQVDDIIIATTVNDTDDIIAEEARRLGVKCYRGSETDVLSRYYLAAKEYPTDIVVRITSDCPLIDPHVVDEIIGFYKVNQYPYVTNGSVRPGQGTYPRGLDTEVFSFRGLEEAYYNATESYQREHVTPYFYEDGKEIYIYKREPNYSHYRWTLDTEADWNFITEVYRYLYKGVHDFYMEDILRLMEEHPELYEINKDIKQKTIK